MKMSVLEMEYKNIRKLSSLKVSFVESTGTIIKNNFIMMANGTGKTTTMTLIKALLDGSALKWNSSTIKSFAPTTTQGNYGEFCLTVKFDEKQYKYILSLNYANGTAKIETLAPPKGRETGLKLPESIKGIFTPEFVSRFVFDGEQAKKSMDRDSNEADETIRYLYRLDELDAILSMNANILAEIQSAEGGSKGTNSSISNLKTRRSTIDKTIKHLQNRQKTLQEEISKYETFKIEKESRRQELDKNYAQLNTEKVEIVSEQKTNRGDIEIKISEIISLIKSPYLLRNLICERMYNLGCGMQKLKLPKNSSKDFFTELANAPTCVCDRCIGEKERTAILKNAERYLGSDQQAVLNTIKSSLISCSSDERLATAFKELEELRTQANRLATRYSVVEDKLIKAGGTQVETLQNEIVDLSGKISVAKARLAVIESKDDSDETLTEENNLPKALKALAEYEKKIASATRTNNALRKKQIVDELIRQIQVKATKALKQEIIKKTNEKVKKVITDDDIEIENIDRYIKLKKREGASEGQTLSIGYCFLGTLFEDSELEFPFIIDSPTGKMDFDKRQAVADIIPHVFNQMIAFVQSAEVERFADQFYDNADSQYLTVITSKDDDHVVVHEGIEFFDSYQREHKGEDI